jgi:class 3 adenylate cyclase
MSSDAGTSVVSDVPRWSVTLALAAPLLGLAILILRPELDATWEHHPSHFWLVLGTAGINVALAYLTNDAASRRADARVFLLSLAFLASAGFLGLHALATPGVLLTSPNAGFVLATPVGLAIASVFAAASITPIGGPRASMLLRHRVALRTGLLLVMAGWAIVSLAGLPPLRGLPPQEAVGPIVVMAVMAVALYGVSAWEYARLYQARRTVLTLATAAALVLLAEAMVAVVLSRNWHLSWWEWHVLMTIAFIAIALGVRAEYRRTGSLSGAFGGIYLEATLARLDRWHARAIADLVAAGERGASADQVVADLRREGASEEEVRLLRQATDEVRRLDALFRPYLPTQVADRLRAEPGIARLGGDERVVSVLFADLASFTTFSESHRPPEVIAMLNEYWRAVVPLVESAGGLIEQFAGDGVMVIFNAVGDQPDHAVRAARTALGIVRVTDPLAAAHAGWPPFRVGVNSGPAVLGNVGAETRRSFAAIGDTANVGARLMAAGEPGQVVIGRGTWNVLSGQTGVDATALGGVRLKGKSEPVDAWLLRNA